MKKYIREILQDLQLTPGQKKPEPVSDPAQRMPQFDQQAQKSEERQR